MLAAFVELRVAEHLAHGPLAAAALAARTGLPADAAERLLRAAVALGLAEPRAGGFGLGPLGAALLGNPGVAAMIAHHRMLYDDLRDPVALLRAGRGDALAGYWPYATAESPASLPGGRVADYSALMAASQPLVAEDILEAIDLRRFGCLLDVGGGEGAFLLAASRRAPALRLMLFDLPPVAARAQARLDAAGLSGRARAIGGSFRHDPLPTGADIVSLVRVVHDHDDEVALALLRAVRAALPAGGTLLLAEPMSGTPGAEPVGDAYFGFYLLAMGSGRPRRPDELFALLHAAGFTDARLLRTRRPMLVRAIRATAPRNRGAL